MEQSLFQPIEGGTFGLGRDFASQADELNHYRQQTTRLTLINELHARLLVADDLQAMVEAFSVWLMPLLDHDLIRYSNRARNKDHVFCSCHGPERRAVLAAVEKKLSTVEIAGFCDVQQEGNFHIYSWKLNNSNTGASISIVAQEGQVDSFHSDILREAVRILEGPIQRAIDHEDLYQQSRRDSLTGLANRRVLDERVDDMIETSRRHQRSLSLLSMDLDRFKQINDTMGHAAGDRVLQQVSSLILQMVRKSDLLVRMGGDEFILLLPDTTRKSARVLAERLCGAVNTLDIKAPDGSRLGISIGLSQWSRNMSREEWLQHADEALYKAKANGRGQVF